MIEYIGGETGGGGMIERFGRKKVDFDRIASLLPRLHAEADPLLQSQPAHVLDECGDVDVAQLMRGIVNLGTEKICRAHPNSTCYRLDCCLGFFFNQIIEDSHSTVLSVRWSVWGAISRNAE